LTFLRVRIEKAIKMIETKQFLKELDAEYGNNVFISSFMKSGTTWLQMILYQLNSDGEMNFNHIYEVIPWIDRDISSNNGKKAKINSKIRIYKTHLNYKYFPKKFKGKFICVLRSGLDVSASQFHHIKDLENPDITFSESFRNYFINSWFKYVKMWITNKNKYKILYVKYEDLKIDLEKEIYRISDFCNIKVEKSEMTRIIERCSFGFMKKHEDKFGVPLKKFNYGNFIRKGETNKGRLYLNDNEYKIYVANFNKHLSEFEIIKDYKTELSAN
jgi:hypothetical protein